MAKVLVLYHSFYGHIEAMAGAVAAGAREVAGAQVDLKRVPETVADDVFRSAGGKADQPAPVAQPGELANYDAIIFGTPTRFGNMTAQMRTLPRPDRRAVDERRARRQGRQRVRVAAPRSTAGRRARS